MKVDFYHLYPRFGNNNFVPPTILDVLSIWSEERGWEVRVKSAKEHAVDLDTDADVVGFSVYTLSANMAYRLADKLRAKGKIVVIGGPHVRGRNYREALTRCDVVASSICREQWETLLGDIEAGRLEPGHLACSTRGGREERIPLSR